MSMAATLSLMKLQTLNPQNPTKLLKPSLPKSSIGPQSLVSSEAFFTKLESSHLPLAALTLPFFFDPQNALATGGEFGILEGRTFALIHPIVMGSLFLYTLWAGYLGWQWRRVRTVQNEISELKKQVKPTPVTPDGTALESPPSPVETKIQQLTEERKELLKGSFRDRHFNAGSILLGMRSFRVCWRRSQHVVSDGKAFPRASFICRSSYNSSLGGCGSSCASYAEGKRNRQKSSHSVERVECFAIRLANTYWD